MRTPPVSLTPLCDIHRQAVISILRNEQIRETYMVPDLPTEADADRLFQALKTLSTQESRFVRGIHHDNVLVGFLNDTEICGSSIELGWVIHPEFQGMGFATEAVRLAIQELFDRGFTQVIAGAFDWNTPSIRVMEKCGMMRMDKADAIEYRGKTHNCVFYHIQK